MGNIHRFVLLLLLVSLLVVSISLADQEESQGKAVHVSLLSNWSNTPLYIETLQFYKERVDDKSYWKFIETFNEAVNRLLSKSSSQSLTESQLYDLIISQSTIVLGDNNAYLVDYLKADLAMRTHSPRVEMLRKLYQTNRQENGIESGEFIQIGNTIIKDLSDIKSIKSKLNEIINSKGYKKEEQTIFSFDSIYPATSRYQFDYITLIQDGTKPTVIYYADIMSSHFQSIHQLLKEMYNDEDNGIIYVLRFVINESKQKAQLQGYGYSLSIKNLEYKVMDDTVIKKEGENTLSENTLANEDVGGFNFHTLSNRYPDLTKNLKTFRSFLMAHQQQTELKVWEIQSLGLQSTQKIISSTDPMRTLGYISQSLPTLANTLSRLSINESLKSMIESNQKIISQGENQLYLNDRVIDLTQEFAFSPSGIINAILDEIKSLFNIKKLGVESTLVNEISTTFLNSNPIRFNINPADKSIIAFLNNLETDASSSKWDGSLNDNIKDKKDVALDAIFVRKNLFTFIVALDLSDESSLETLISIQSLIHNQVPLRFGLLLKTSDQSVTGDGMSSALLAKVFLSFKDKMGHRAALFFINALNYYKRMYGVDTITMGLVQTAFSTVVNQMGNRVGGIAQIMNSNTYDALLLNANLYLDEQIMIKSFPQSFLNGLLMDIKKLESEQVPILCFNELLKSLDFINNNQINDETEDIYSTLLSIYEKNQDLINQFNPTIIPTTDNPAKFVELVYKAGADDETNKVANEFLDSFKWYRGADADTQGLDLYSHIIVGDFNQINVCKLALNAMERLYEFDSVRKQVRFGFINTNPESGVGKALSMAKATTNKDSLIQLFKLQITSSGPVSFEISLDLLKLSKKDDQDRIQAHQSYAIDYLGINQEMAESKVFIITNGRLIELSTDSQQPIFNQFKVLEKYESSKIFNILNVFHSRKQEDKLSSDLLMKLISLFSKKLIGGGTGGDSSDGKDVVVRKPLPGGLVPSFIVNPVVVGDNPSNLVRFQMVIDPLSKQAQKMVSIVNAISTHFGIGVDVYLNPQLQLSELPLKSFYTYIVQLSSKFDANGKPTHQPSGVLVNLPESRVLTMAIDAPSVWIVKPIVAKYDLDNIRLRDVHEQVLSATFELEHLIIQGFSFDWTTLGAPGGLELAIDDHSDPQNQIKSRHQDTLVMGNGYFQLKANPGLWKLSTLGRGKNILDILNLDQKSTRVRNIADLTNVQRVPSLWLVTDSFKGQSIYLQFTRKKGQERENILPPIDQKDSQNIQEDEDEGYFSSLFGGGKKKTNNNNGALSTGSKNETIHIFSVASGHLYERFLKIMMLSVSQNTKSPLKFWFLKNYLSPKFVSFIPEMAKQYGFEYELVTYNWPSFLRAQTEKQRIIWAYKILFLDVLFPLNVKKIIFVDADQVVRTDLKELWDMDLHGASLGYTPFCDSNKDTEGFRFWKSGYWKDHLRGKPYHISALYVVDLQRFRRLVAGDQLRMTYDQLSRDPNSLANLDQDLPNYLQHHVRIHSLPQEWLWCETWCSQESKAKAKTIDLCNNPLTKTPKLENAVRIISEWTSLDNEVKQFEASLEKEQEESNKTNQQSNGGIDQSTTTASTTTNELNLNDKLSTEELLNVIQEAQQEF